MSAGNFYKIIAEGKETDKRFSLMETLLEPGQAAPQHIHSREDEAFFILEGEVTFQLDDRQIAASTEDFISCPPDTSRSFRNNTDKTARILLFYSTADVEEMTIRDGNVVQYRGKGSELNARRKIQCPTLVKEYGIIELDDNSETGTK